MSSLFPSSLPLAGSAVTSATLAASGHTALHNNLADEARAIATKLGTGSSTPASGLILGATGAGTSSWRQVDLNADSTGILSTSRGGTGTNTTTGTGAVVYNSSPTISSPTISGGGSWTGSPTLSTPSIASFSNAQHNHSNAAGGGVLNTSVLNNPYKFSVYRNAAASTGNATFAVIAFDTELFDTSSNITGGVFTAPVTAFYWFGWLAQAVAAGAGEQFVASLYVNGVRMTDGIDPKTSGAVDVASIGTDFISLAAGDTVDIRAYDSAAARAINVGATYVNYFKGFLVSAT